MAPPLIVLFDIDGTLLNAHGAGRRALERAFVEVTGLHDAISRVDFRGMTDLGILEAGFAAKGMKASAEVGRQVLLRYLSLLEQELLGDRTAILLPGAVALLDWIETTFPLAAVGLGTGNIEAGAYAKLRAVGLAHRFGFGGFGSDHAERHEILRVGAERGAARHGAIPSECRTLAIGDTLRDVGAALAIGAECIAVGTSGVELSSLAAAGAHLAVPTLEEPQVREHLLGRG
jgi:phosphoglycolate phosphatase